MCKQTEKSWWEKNSSCIMLVIIAGFAIAGWCVMSNQKNACIRQQQLIAYQTDSLVSTFVQNADPFVVVSRTDTIINKKQSVIERYVIQDEKILQSFKIEASSIEKNLQIQSNAIQSQYTLLSIWAAIIMVVFLIYTFYSLFKADDLAKEGRERLQNIDTIHENVKEIQKNIETDKATAEKAINDISDKIDDEIKKQKDAIILPLQTEYEDKKKQVDELIQALKQARDVTGDFAIGGEKTLDNTGSGNDKEEYTSIIEQPNLKIEKKTRRSKKVK